MPRNQIRQEEVHSAQAAATKGAIYKIWPGIVKAYYAAQAGQSVATVDVQIAITDPRIDPETDQTVFETMAVIPKVPLAWPQGGGFTFSFPMQANDGVTLLAYDLDPTQHRGTGQVANPLHISRHSASYWLALPFNITDANALGDPGANAFVGQPGGVGVELSPSSVNLGQAGASTPVSLSTLVDSFITMILGATAGAPVEAGYNALQVQIAAWKLANWTVSSTTGAKKVNGV